MKNVEIIYLDRDNVSEAVLKSDEVAVDTSAFTQMTLSFGKHFVVSTNQATDPIRWNKTGYMVGEVKFYLGNLIGINPADYPRVPFVIYSAEWPNGYVWNFLRFLAEEV